MPPGQTSAEQFKPKWTHFPLSSIIWVQNPFNEDITWQVADEFNRPMVYKIKALGRAELPGGPIATLGVKYIVDRLIQGDKDDAMRIWEPEVRQKYEEQVIVRVKDDPRQTTKTPEGEIDLSVKESGDEVGATKDSEPAVEDFPDLKAPQVDLAGTDAEPAPIIANPVADLPEAQVIEED